ncbi:MAG: RNA polymerase sigma-70 factor [Ferruginibacter sp.]|nr:RNA polymerase sigma-70 factor [Ferruginibacter sp.]
MLKNHDHIKLLQQNLSLNEDMQAYQGLYDIFFNRLKIFCFSLVKSNEAAEEIVSDVFIKLWQIRGRLMEVDNLVVYLYTIAKNFSFNYITKNYKHPVINLDKIDIESVISLDSPEELCISADLVNAIHQAIRQLPPQCRLIFQMVKEDGLKYKEVAEILHISVLTVRNQVAIATRKIAETLPAYISAGFVKTRNAGHS